MKRNEKSPLQQWAWHRYRIKGVVSRDINGLRALLRETIEDTAPDERFYIGAAVADLEKVLKHWEKNHKATRRRRENE